MRGLSAELPSLLLRIVSEGMRRLSTALVVVAVAALAVFAAADALRGDDELKAPAASPTSTRPKSPTLRETLRGQGVSGQILYSDQDCILHSLVLPQMVDDVVRRENGAGALHHCRFSVAGGRFRDDDELMSPDGQLVARCRAGHVEVFIESGERRLSHVPGCAPAWHPDNGLTYARNGEILLGGGVALISKRELRRIARRHPNVGGLGAGVPFRVRVLALAWLDEAHLAASLRVDIESVEPQHFVVLLNGDRVVALVADFRGPIRELVVSPTGSFLADDRGTVVTKQGRSYPLLEGIPRPSTVAFSPDEGWLAVATGVSVYLVGTPRNLGRVIRLPVRAQDLVWEDVSRATRVAGLGTG
jgi:hypothetical protein